MEHSTERKTNTFKTITKTTNNKHEIDGKTTKHNNKLKLNKKTINKQKQN